MWANPAAVATPELCKPRNVPVSLSLVLWDVPSRHTCGINVLVTVRHPKNTPQPPPPKKALSHNNTPESSKHSSFLLSQSPARTGSLLIALQAQLLKFLRENKTKNEKKKKNPFFPSWLSAAAASPLPAPSPWCCGWGDDGWGQAEQLWCCSVINKRSQVNTTIGCAQPGRGSLASNSFGKH